VTVGDSPVDPGEAVIGFQRDDESESGDGARGSFDVVVTFCAVVTTLLAAVVAYLHSDAARTEDRAIADAQRAAISASRSTQRSRSAAHTDLARLEAVVQNAALEGNARQRSVLLGGGAPRADHWQALQELAAGRIDAKVGDQTTDAFFPWGFLDRREYTAAYWGARRDTLNDYSAQWGKRVATYMGLLTVLAVGLYLFGFSLTRPGRHMSGVFATIGGIFLMVGLVFGPLQALFPPTAPSKEAARAYAAGYVALLLAKDPADYAGAERHMRVAIDEWPRFARAYLLAAAAHQRASSPQTAQFMSLAPAKARRRTTTDFEKARELGLASVAGDLGFDLWALGLVQDRPDLLRRAAQQTRVAIEREPENPIPVFNRAVALLSSGRTEAARAAYRDGLAVARENPDYELYRGSWLSGALTDLELVRRHAPVSLATDVQAMKELVVGSLGVRVKGRPARTKSVLEVFLRVDPGRATVLVQGTRPSTDVYSVQWYLLLPGLGWAHLMEPSGWGGTVGYPLTIAHVNTTGPPRCYPAGRYRAEIYAGGRLVWEGETENAFTGFKPLTERHLGIGACMPEEMAPVGAQPLADQGSVATYRAAYARNGRPERGTLTLLRLNDAPSRRGAAGLSEALASGVRHVATTRRLSLRRAPQIAAPPSEFVTHTVASAHRYEGGLVLASAARDRDGSILVAVTFGPEGWLESSDPMTSEAWAMHSSVVPLYRYPRRRSG
jgi:tetratricopeptide (TPR) repeat protein